MQPASVAEILITLGSGFRNQSVQFLVRFGSKLEIAFLQETVRHFYQLVRIVIVKVELERETFLQAGVGTEHLLHLVLVAGQDDNHIRVGFREHGEQGVNHLFPEIFRFLFRGNQGVGFVDEKYAAPGFLDGLPDVLFCLTDVFAHQLGAACLYSMSAGKESHLVIQLSDEFGHRRLSCTGIA
ncbi:unknown [Phocaeicola plebeius CAG:211]|uniref:Uncharacterized protein n=1 Tax=Phocaeicola plebeius CAG:211 TaxID=1263052 RepID=R5VF80_9BACT|nr:unknown [Phocaeicola plebeius CAG:211]